MLKKIREFEQNFTIGKAAGIVGFFALLAKLVALARDSLLAGKFGPGDTLDIYYAAFRMPDFIFNLLVLGTLSVAFIPVFTELLLKDEKKAYRVANSVLNVSVMSMGLLCFALFFFARPLTHALVPGFSGEKFNQTVQLTKLFLLSPVIFTLSSVFTSILSSQKKFLVLSFAPMLYNLGIIFGLFFFYPKFGVLGLGFGVILGALCHLLIQIPEAVRLGFRWQAVLDYKEPTLHKIAKLFLPRIIGMDNSQISLLIGTIIGSILAAGSITVFNFANNLQAVPLGIFAISFATASFPALSEHFAAGDEKQYAQTLSRTMVQILYFMIPISILMLIFRAYIVRLVLGHGQFGWDDTITTFQTLGVFSFGLLSQSVGPLLSKAFYARQNTKLPVIVNSSTIVLNAILAYVLGKSFGVVGIAAGFVFSSILDCLILFILLRLKIQKNLEIIRDFDQTLVSSLKKTILASAVLGFVSYAGIYIAAPIVNTHTTLGILLQSGFAVSLGVGAFLVLSFKMNMEQTKTIVEFLKRLFGKKALVPVPTSEN